MVAAGLVSMQVVLSIAMRAVGLAMLPLVETDKLLRFCGDRKTQLLSNL